MRAELHEVSGDLSLTSPPLPGIRSSPMSVQEQQQKRKRKQPPTFQHLHPSQGTYGTGSFQSSRYNINSSLAAKKLKKAWIEKAQIKSKWSREKRKLQDEGVIPVAKKPWEIPGEEQEETQGNEDNEVSAPRPQETPSEVESEAEERPMKRSKHSAPQKGELPPHLCRNDPSSSRSVLRQPRPEKSMPKSSWQNEIHNAASHTKDSKGKSKVHYSRDNADESDEEREKSLRDLKREAYDEKNLHNFRADPLHKQSGRGRFSTARGRGGGGGGPGRGGHGGREPRGQPNMKMRMNYMLEKIKKDYAALST